MREILRGAAVAFTVKVFGSGVAFLFNVYLARALGVEGAGVYFLAISVVTVASVIARLGVDNALLKYVAAGESANEWGLIQGVVRKSLFLVSSVSLSLTVLLVLLADWVALIIFNKPEMGSVLRIMALAVLPFSLLILFSEMLRALRLVLESQVIQGLLVPLLNILMLYSLVAVLGLLAAPISFLIATTGTALLGWLLWRKKSSSMDATKGDFSWKKLFDSCVPLYGVALLNEGVVQGLPYLLLGMFKSSVEVGVFGAAMRTSLLVALVLVVVNIVVAPKMAALFQKQQYSELESMMQKSTVLMTVLSMPILIVFLLFPSIVMSTFGASFESGGVLLLILTIGQAVNVICGPAGYFLIMTGQEKLLRQSVLIASAATGILAIGLIPNYGSTGAAISSATSLTLLNLMSVYFVRKRLGALSQGA